MNTKGFAPLALVLVIAGFLIVGGGVWYFLHPNSSPLQNQKIGGDKDSTIADSLSGTSSQPASSDIFIISPKNNDSFKPGEKVVVKLSVPAGVKDIGFIISSKLGLKEIIKPPYESEFIVPDNIIGGVDIGVIGGKLENGKTVQGGLIYNGSVRINIQTSQRLTQLTLGHSDPPGESIIIAILPGDQPGSNHVSGLIVTGIFSDGTKKNLTDKNTGTTYSIDDTSIAYVNTNNMMVSKKYGETFLKISNSGIEIKIPIRVLCWNIDQDPNACKGLPEYSY
ncbi:MAG: hypothetical protein AAB903_01920 [Patescibacteria group bacterium]